MSELILKLEKADGTLVAKWELDELSCAGKVIGANEALTDVAKVAADYVIGSGWVIPEAEVSP